MTTETRYMQVPSWTVNGLTASKLSSQEVSSTVATQETSGDEIVYCAWDVIKRDSLGTETVIGSKVAQVSRDANGSGIQSATWDCPLTSLAITDAIRVICYIKLGYGSWIATGGYLSRGWITEQLGATQLSAATWTFYAYTYRSYDGDYTVGGIYYGSTTYETRIEGFTWSAVAVAGGLKMVPSLKGHMGYDLKTRGGKARRRVF